MAHPERPGWLPAGAQAEEGAGSVAAGARARQRIAAGATTPAASMLSTSSFSPPQPLVLLAVRPLGRVSRPSVWLARPGLTMEAGFGPRSMAARALAYLCSPAPDPRALHAASIPRASTCRRVAALARGFCAAVAGCGGRRRSGSSAAGLLPSTSRSRPTSAGPVATTGSRQARHRHPSLVPAASALQAPKRSASPGSQCSCLRSLCWARVPFHRLALARPTAWNGVSFHWRFFSLAAKLLP